MVGLSALHESTCGVEVWIHAILTLTLKMGVMMLPPYARGNACGFCRSLNGRLGGLQSKSSFFRRLENSCH